MCNTGIPSRQSRNNQPSFAFRRLNFDAAQDTPRWGHASGAQAPVLQTARAAGYANVAWSKLAREASGKVMESPLRGGVDCATVRRMRAEDRTDIDDASSSLAEMLYRFAYVCCAQIVSRSGRVIGKDGAGPLPEIEIARFGMHTACKQAA